MMTTSAIRERQLRSHVIQAQEIIAAGRLPEPLEAKLKGDLRDAVRKGFHVDLEQLELALTRFSR